MQLLFSVNRDQQLELTEAKERYWGSIEDTFSLLLLNIYALINIVKVASKDLEKRKSKHLPSDIDKAFKDKLYNNSLVKNLEQNSVLQKKLRQLKFSEGHSDDYFDSIYYEFAKTPQYEA